MKNVIIVSVGEEISHEITLGALAHFLEEEAIYEIQNETVS